MSGIWEGKYPVTKQSGFQKILWTSGPDETFYRALKGVIWEVFGQVTGGVTEGVTGEVIGVVTGTVTGQSPGQLARELSVTSFEVAINFKFPLFLFFFLV